MFELVRGLRHDAAGHAGDPGLLGGGGACCGVRSHLVPSEAPHQPKVRPAAVATRSRARHAQAKHTHARGAQLGAGDYACPAALASAQRRLSIPICFFELGRVEGRGRGQNNKVRSR